MSGNSSRQRSYQGTDQTPQVLSELREAFGVANDSAVIRRALGLARLMAQEVGDDHTVTIVKKDGTQVKLLLNG